MTLEEEKKQYFFFSNSIKLIVLNILYSQEAIKDQQIEFKEIDTNHLGSDKEYQIPKNNNASNSGSSSSSNSSGS